MTFSFAHIHTFSKKLISTKEDSVKNRSTGEVHVMLTSIGFRWRQHMFMKGLNKFCIQVVICDCIAVEITGSGDPTLLAGFIYAVRYHSFLQTVQKTISHQNRFSLIINMAERKWFKPSEIYLPSPAFFHVVFSRASASNNVAVSVSEEQCSI
jgi:hypothetical protein